MRGDRVQLSADYHQHRPPVDVAQREIRDRYVALQRLAARPADDRVHTGRHDRRDALELTENVRVRRTGPDRYAHISDLAPVRRYAPRAPGEKNLTRDMPDGPVRTARLLSAPRHGMAARMGGKAGREFSGMAKAIADVFEAAATGLMKQAADAKQRAP